LATLGKSGFSASYELAEALKEADKITKSLSGLFKIWKKIIFYSAL